MIPISLRAISASSRYPATVEPTIQLRHRLLHIAAPRAPGSPATRGAPLPAPPAGYRRGGVGCQAITGPIAVPSSSER